MFAQLAQIVESWPATNVVVRKALSEAAQELRELAGVAVL